MKKKVRGTTGYARSVQRFIEVTNSISFQELHKDFIHFIPKQASRILDVGAGIGRDAFILAGMGHFVVAVEPVQEFQIAGNKLFPSPNLTWIEDSLAELKKIEEYNNQFDFILASAMWHHLDHDEQHTAIARISKLLNKNGMFALSLRHGPAGKGTISFPICDIQTIENAKSSGFIPLRYLKHQASLLPNKANITWSRLVFQLV